MHLKKKRIFEIGLFLSLCLGTALLFPSAVSADTSRNAEYKKAPLFSKKQNWLQGELRGRKAFRNKLTLVYFWEYATVNCIRELEFIDAFKARYEALGFQVVYVHAPEFRFAYEADNVRRAAARLGISDPIVLDNDAALWDAYHNRSWPTKHLVNSRGEIVYSAVGEGNYIDFETEIRDAIKAMNPKAFLPEREVFSEQDRFNIWECGEMSTEVYVGYKRANWWGVEISNEETGDFDKMTAYEDDGRRMERGVFLQGNWANREEFLEHGSGDGYIGIIYLGTDVYGVLEYTGSDPAGARIYFERDEEPVPAAYHGADMRMDERGGSYVDVREPRLYYLIQGEDPQYHELKAVTSSQDVRFYLFSFSNRCLSDFDHR